jgi:hypothetical protein
MRRARMLLMSALVLSLPASVAVPATALAHPQQVAQAAVPQVQEADGVPAAPSSVRTFPVLGGVGVAWAPGTDGGGAVES